MELSQEEINKFWKEKEESESRMRERNKRHKEIYDLYKSGQLKNINPIWHINAEEIELTKQKENLTSKLLENGFTIIENIDIELLFDNMPSGNPEMFRKRKLYNNSLDEFKTSEVLDNWIKGVKLIPPTILVIDETIEKGIENTTKIYPTDGKHRLNAAYFFGAKKIPIFVINKQIESIKKILKLN